MAASVSASTSDLYDARDSNETWDVVTVGASVDVFRRATLYAPDVPRELVGSIRLGFSWPVRGRSLMTSVAKRRAVFPPDMHTYIARNSTAPGWVATQNRKFLCFGPEKVYAKGNSCVQLAAIVLLQDLGPRGGMLIIILAFML